MRRFPNKKTLVGALVFASFLLFLFHRANEPTQQPSPLAIPGGDVSWTGLPAPVEHDFWITRDPASGRVPPGIRRLELAHAQAVAEQGSSSLFEWIEAGPDSLGGRTLAVALDVTNPQVVLAGSSSGGLWKSDDQGQTWRLTTAPNEQFSVTTLAQDNRPGHTEVWYMAGGEFRGSAGPLHAISTGNYALGVYKSTDNGATWALLPGATAGDPATFDSAFDYVNKIVVSPTTGTVFLANNASGIYRSADGGASFPRVLGTTGQHNYNDVAVGPDGTVLAVLSTLTLNGGQSAEGGVYLSRDDGQTWSEITPPTFPSSHQRSMVALAPSNPNVAYILTMVSRTPGTIQEDIRFYRLDLQAGTSEDRSGNLPNYNGFVAEGASLSTLLNFTMVLNVKPDDENFVIAGGIVPYRSRDGFATPIPSYPQARIGGYACITRTCFDFTYFFHYSDHWNDQHAVFFNPANPNEMWSANDGGIYVTRDVTRDQVIWENKNRGYNVAQFYGVTISDEAGDGRILGGLQDHGVEYVQAQAEHPAGITDYTQGERVAYSDGTHVHLGKKHALIGLANGVLHRLRYEDAAQTDLENFYDYVAIFNAGLPDLRPPGASGFKFYVHPYAFDPVDDQTVYYPDGSTASIGATLWRNPDINTGISAEVVQRWERLDNFALPSGYLYTAFGVSRRPAHILYMGATAAFSAPATPKIFRIENATTTTAPPVEISIPNTPIGAHVQDIAVNPLNADEILVVMSNYKIIGLYHSIDGGQTYTAVEGNLEGPGGSGPSLRGASILPLWELGSVQSVYFVAASTGVYSTRALRGMNTMWEQEATDLMGGVVVDDIISRPSDGRVVAGTHGRGLMVGILNPTLVALEPEELPSGYALSQNYPNPFNPTTRIDFTLAAPSHVTLTIYDATGRKVRDLLRGQVQKAGTHAASFDAVGLASGTYLYRLEVQPQGRAGPGFAKTRTMTLVK